MIRGDRTYDPLMLREIARPVRVVTAILGLAGLVTIVEAAIAAGDPLVGLGLFGLPTIGSVWIGRACLAPRAARTLVAILTGAALLYAVGALLVLEDAKLAFLFTLVVNGTTLVLALPMWFVARVVGRRRTVETSDWLLALGGAWFFGVEAIGALVLPKLAPQVALPALVAGLVGVAGAARIVLRRRWCERVIRREIPSCSARELSPFDALPDVPRAYGEHGARVFVLERVTPARDAYRDASHAEPFATVGLAES